LIAAALFVTVSLGGLFAYRSKVNPSGSANIRVVAFDTPAANQARSAAPGSMGAEGDPEETTIFFVPAGQWSDGTTASMDRP